MTLSASYDATTAQDLYRVGPTGNVPRALWAGEKLLHDLSHIGLWSFFEGPGPDPSVLSGYALTKIWLKTAAGVTTSQGTFWVYLASEGDWVELTPDTFALWHAESASSWADQAAASATEAAASAALAATLAGVSAVYSTHAEMTAAANGLAANAYVVVLVDETRSNQMVIYRKVSGVMTFQRVILATGGVVDVRDFGLTGGSDQTAQFETLRQYLVANDGSTVFFPPGVTYKSSNNRWLVGVRNVTINAYGAKFQYVNGATVITGSAQYCPVMLGGGEITHTQTTGPIINGDYTPYSGITPTSGVLINAATAGAASITTTTAGDAGGHRGG